MSLHRVSSLLLLALLGSSGFAQTPTKTPIVAPSKGATPPQIKIAEQPIVPFTVWQLRAGDSTESQVTPIQLNPSGYWLMAYIDLKSPVSLALLGQLQTLATTPVPPSPYKPVATSSASSTGAATATTVAPSMKINASKLVIIVAHASGAELSQFELGYPGLATSAWTHDEKSAAAKLLGIHGTPHLFGMHEGLQRWQLSASLKPSDLEPALTTWASFNQLPQNKLTRHKATPPAQAIAAAKAGSATTPPPTASSPGPTK